MSAASPQPEKLLLLAAIGIGVYWFMSRRAHAAPVVTAQTAAPSTGPGLAGVLGSVGKALSGLLGTSSTSTAAMASGAAVGAANAASDTYAGADWSQLASSAVDGVAANPPVGTVFDTSAGFGYLSGSGSLGD